MTSDDVRTFAYSACQRGEMLRDLVIFLTNDVRNEEYDGNEVNQHDSARLSLARHAVIDVCYFPRKALM